MHNAFQLEAVIEKLPLTIECITCFENTLLVGTREGHLLVYSIRSDGASCSVNLDNTHKSFSKKRIAQLYAARALRILISLSDSVVSVHDLFSLAPISVLQKTRGAALFAVHAEEVKTQTGEVQCTLRLCVAVKRKLQLYYWKKKEFQDFKEDLAVPDTPRVIAFSLDSICVGLKRDYHLINMNTGEIRELFPVSRDVEPVAIALCDSRLAVTQDLKTVFVDSEGNLHRQALQWTESPLDMIHWPPYMLSVLPRYVEIRTVESRALVQSLELEGGQHVAKSTQAVFVCSAKHVWRLRPVPIAGQVEELLQQEQVDLALELVDLLPAEEQSAHRQAAEFRRALQLFRGRRFEDAMQQFLELHTAVTLVIGLFPGLLPAEIQSAIHYPLQLPPLSGSDAEKGLEALAGYLTQIRNSLASVNDALLERLSAHLLSTSKEHLAMLVDTTLLKCYLRTTDALVAPLLRLDNVCVPEEAERELKAHGKLQELLILYEKKQMHKQALELLRKHASQEGSTLSGLDPSVRYLQRLGAQHIDLLVTNARWVLGQSPQQGLAIFTDDLPEVEALPRERILAFLEDEFPTLAVEYLQRILHQWDEPRPELHTRLALLLAEQPDAEALAQFLDWSDRYQPERLIHALHNDALWRSRVSVLMRLGHGEEALRLAAPRDPDLAERLCQEELGLFSLWLQLLLSSKEMERAVELLSRFGSSLDPLRIVDLLPRDLKLQRMAHFLVEALLALTRRRRDAQVLKSLSTSALLQAREQRMAAQARKTVLSEDESCHVCRRRIGLSAFARMPDGALLHLGCLKRDLQ